MALNLKTLATRSISAAVFVVLLVGCVYWNYYSFSIFFFVVAMLGLNEFYKISEKLGASPYKIIGFISGVILYSSLVYYEEFLPKCESCYSHEVVELMGDIEKALGGIVVALPFIILAVALFSKKEKSIQNGLYTIGGIIYSVLPFALLNQTVVRDDGCLGPEFSPKIILGIIFMIWSNDTFAYLGGSLFGKNKMIERVSPGKTWEGTIIGVFITLVLSVVIGFVYELNIVVLAILGITIPILATIGDLVESKLKREAGIKDSGNIMPGHGGVLDRFDSLIFVSPFVFALFKL